MSREDIDRLLMKVLGDEASSEEKSQLAELLRTEPGLDAEFEDLEAVRAAVRQVQPLLEALRVEPKPIPQRTLDQLLQGIRGAAEQRTGPSSIRPTHGSQAFGGRTSAWLASLWKSPDFAAAVILVALTFIVPVFWQGTKSSADRPRKGGEAYLVPIEGHLMIQRQGRAPSLAGVQRLQREDRIEIPSGAKAAVLSRKGIKHFSGQQDVSVRDLMEEEETGTVRERGLLATALFDQATVLSTLLSSTRSSEFIRLYSPLGATTRVQPTIVWDADPGKRYDLTIRDEFDPQSDPWEWHGVAPPVVFGTGSSGSHRPLAPNGLYRLRLSEVRKPLSATEYTFRTLANLVETVPRTPNQRLSEAYRILQEDPGCLGDAFAELAALPPEGAKSDLALRLKLFVFGQEGYAEEFQNTMQLISHVEEIE